MASALEVGPCLLLLSVFVKCLCVVCCVCVSALAGEVLYSLHLIALCICLGCFPLAETRRWANDVALRRG